MKSNVAVWLIILLSFAGASSNALAQTLAANVVFAEPPVLSPIQTEQDLAAVISDLENPATQERAFLRIMADKYPHFSFADNPQRDAMQGAALKALRESPERERIVNRAIESLRSPQTRFQAIITLRRFGGGRMRGSAFSSSGDRVWDGLMDRAAAAPASVCDFSTVQQAMNSANPDLQMWALNSWSQKVLALLNEQRCAPEVGNIGDWEKLKPRILELAVSDDAQVRGLAFGLAPRDFVRARIGVETSPDNLMRMCYGFEDNKQLFLRNMARILRHADEKVRYLALLTIGFNSHHAPMWQFIYNREIFARVIELTQSSSRAERAAAAYALTELRGLDPERARAAFVKLAGDPEPDVRRRIGFGLKDQLDREDLQPVLEKLLHDPVASVRLETIYAFSEPERTRRLQKLLQDKHATIAAWARDLLRDIAQEQSAI